MLEELKSELSKILNESEIIVDDIYIEEKNNYKFFYQCQNNFLHNMK